ncbi:Uu.00g022530.m01.CDS01, partial [Anthostomella pinea]
RVMLHEFILNAGLPKLLDILERPTKTSIRSEIDRIRQCPSHGQSDINLVERYEAFDWVLRPGAPYTKKKSDIGIEYAFYTFSCADTEWYKHVWEGFLLVHDWNYFWDLERLIGFTNGRILVPDRDWEDMAEEYSFSGEDD